MRLEARMNKRVARTMITISGMLPLQAPAGIRRRFSKLKPRLDVWRCLKGLWLYGLQKEDPAFKTIKLRPLPRVREDLEPIAVRIVELERLTRSFNDLLSLFEGLLPSNPLLGDLKDHVAEAYRKYRASA